MTVSFWSHFYKRSNSTMQPSTTATVVFDCMLKDNSGILSPVLEIANGSTWNPSEYNYAYITLYNRYYYVSDWTYIGGRWECSLEVDALASHKASIGSQSMYIVRSSYAYDKDAIDDFYPMLAARYTNYVNTNTFNFKHDFDEGMYILGIANRAAYGTGAISYYAMSSSQIRSLVQYMLVSASEVWDQTTFAGMTDTLWRSIYSPFDYIKSCKWFPIAPVTSGTSVLLSFGNYNTGLSATLLPNDFSTWGLARRTVSLPTGWTSRDAKYRTSPACKLYLVCNPWGVMELNPMDFTDSDTIRLEYIPDFITGDSLLKIYKQVGSSYYLIAQKTAKTAIDINLSATSVDATGVISGLLGIAGASVGIATAGSGVGVAQGILAAAGSTISAAASSTPTLSNSLGQTANSAICLEGEISLIMTEQLFADENNAEFGRPLNDVRQISNIPGFIKCGEGHLFVDAYPAERDTIESALTDGFFYE